MKKRMLAATLVAGLMVQGAAWGVGDKDLAGQVARPLDMDAATVESVIGAVKETIVTNLREGEEVRLSHFGRFYKETREAHEGRNPGTGETVQVPERAYLRFRPFDSGHERLR